MNSTHSACHYFGGAKWHKITRKKSAIYNQLAWGLEAAFRTCWSLISGTKAVAKRTEAGCYYGEPSAAAPSEKGSRAAYSITRHYMQRVVSRSLAGPVRCQSRRRFHRKDQARLSRQTGSPGGKCSKLGSHPAATEVTGRKPDPGVGQCPVVTPIIAHHLNPIPTSADSCWDFSMLILG